MSKNKLNQRLAYFINELLKRTVFPNGAQMTVLWHHEVLGHDRQIYILENGYSLRQWHGTNLGTLCHLQKETTGIDGL